MQRPARALHRVATRGVAHRAVRRATPVVVTLLALALLAACDRTTTSVTIEDDGSGSWERSVVFFDDGALADDFAALRAAAIDHADDPSGFLSAALPEVFPELAAEADAVADIDRRLVEEFGLEVTSTVGRVEVTTSGEADDYRTMTGDFGLPGTFSVSASGNQLYTVDNVVATLFPVPDVGTIGTTGRTIFEFTAPGRVVEHNAHEIDGRTLRWIWEGDDLGATDPAAGPGGRAAAGSGDAPTAAADSDGGRTIADILDPLNQGDIRVAWDPDDRGGSGTLRRVGLLAIAALALIIAVAVLLTFRPDDFDSVEWDDGDFAEWDDDDPVEWDDDQEAWVETSAADHDGPVIDRRRGRRSRTGR